jgi:LSD1 subclass zinc finger protein
MVSGSSTRHADILVPLEQLQVRDCCFLGNFKDPLHIPPGSMRAACAACSATQSPCNCSPPAAAELVLVLPPFLDLEPADELAAAVLPPAS